MPELSVSPLAPKRFPKLPDVAGVRLGAIAAGVRYKGRPDVLLAEFAPGTAVAGVFTRNSMPGAPVDWCRRHIAAGKARALLVNSGNANVFNGREGLAAVEACAAGAAEAVGCRPQEVFVASTGVIGERLAFERILKALGRAHAKAKPGAWRDAARAISTTDTFHKGAGALTEIGGKPVAIAGICKGSGMIAPDMATMLAFVFTDAKLPAAVLDALLRRANEKSFNCVTVDSDTSTSDCALLFATGAAAHPRIADADDPKLAAFAGALDAVMLDLAHQVVRDGEGATKFVEIRIAGAANDAAAKRIGLAIANSPLVKTAIAGEDANWGRIVMAVGKAGEKADRDRLAIRIGGVLVAEKGYRSPAYREADVVPHMKGQDILIEVDVGVGRGQAVVWTCDLTHGYISINGDYRS